MWLMCRFCFVVIYSCNKQLFFFWPLANFNYTYIKIGCIIVNSLRIFLRSVPTFFGFTVKIAKVATKLKLEYWILVLEVLLDYSQMNFLCSPYSSKPNFWRDCAQTVYLSHKKLLQTQMGRTLCWMCWTIDIPRIIQFQLYVLLFFLIRKFYYSQLQH